LEVRQSGQRCADHCRAGNVVGQHFVVCSTEKNAVKLLIRYRRFRLRVETLGELDAVRKPHSGNRVLLTLDGEHERVCELLIILEWHDNSLLGSLGGKRRATTGPSTSRRPAY
jgi:hypothetical protein